MELTCGFGLLIVCCVVMTHNECVGFSLNQIYFPKLYCKIGKSRSSSSCY